jgi:Na+/pantothenate symporter
MMFFERRVSPPVLVAMAVAMVAATLGLILGFTGNVAAMAYLTGLAIVAVAVAVYFAFRGTAAKSPRT